MADLAKALGLPHLFTFEGKEYQIPPVNLEIWAAWERKLENDAWLRVERSKPLVPREIYRERHDDMTRLVASGYFAWNGEASKEAAATEEGVRWLLAHCLMAGNPGVHRAEADRVVEACLLELEARANEHGSDPKTSGSPLSGSTASPGEASPKA